MKVSSAVTVSALAAVAVAKPSFTNSNFDVKQGQSFDLTFTGCTSGGCTLYLENGPANNLQPVQTLTSTFWPTRLHLQLVLPAI
jgi:hypothetical protein